MAAVARAACACAYCQTDADIDSHGRIVLPTPVRLTFARPSGVCVRSVGILKSVEPLEIEYKRTSYTHADDAAHAVLAHETLTVPKTRIYADASTVRVENSDTFGWEVKTPTGELSVTSLTAADISVSPRRSVSVTRIGRRCTVVAAAQSDKDVPQTAGPPQGDDAPAAVERSATKTTKKTRHRAGKSAVPQPLPKLSKVVLENEDDDYECKPEMDSINGVERPAWTCVEPSWTWTRLNVQKFVRACPDEAPPIMSVEQFEKRELGNPLLTVTMEHPVSRNPVRMTLDLVLIYQIPKYSCVKERCLDLEADSTSHPLPMFFDVERQRQLR